MRVRPTATDLTTNVTSRAPIFIRVCIFTRALCYAVPPPSIGIYVFYGVHRAQRARAHTFSHVHTDERAIRALLRNCPRGESLLAHN